MKLISVILIVLSLAACKTTKVQVVESTKLNPWEKMDFKPEKEMVLPNGYSTYLLDTEVFIKQLEIGSVLLPLANGQFARYNVRNSETMSPELQAKFPNIKSYAGVDDSNSLCQCRIDQKESEFKIAVFCNDQTYYIQDLHDLGLYFIFNKKDLPEGVGTIKE